MTREQTTSFEQGDVATLGARFVFDGPVGEVLRRRFIEDRDNETLGSKFRLYYRFRPLLPIFVRQWLQKWRNQSIKVPPSWYIPSGMVSDLQAAIEQNSDCRVIHPWPDRFEMAVSLTHDVETKQGMQGIERIAKMEEDRGLRSAWNLVPYKYKVDLGFVRELKQRGHEVGVQGYNHDGRLFESKRMFQRRIGPINESIRAYGAKGFRSPMVHRNLAWMQQLDIDYDTSTFDIDPFQAMPGGVGSVWPIIVGKFVELPYTQPQDHTLLVSLGEQSPQIWIDKFQFLRKLAGMAMVITHPDYLDSAARLDVYREYLDFVAEQTDCWNALPHEITTWWRNRDKMSIVGEGDSSRIVGAGSERARVVQLCDFRVDP
ncbi:hypothetical protein Q31b_04380 [Novipirellula aureliae]|uniref:Polysaccharide deacetylase n=1 Tax=Novipirellula aureliae TaxID=2527966 RepID=A0A5C6EBF0_9BACT|nr:hypothetical protein [Novipirellula aureliae]TWU45267.1 hypothetical protein Q31b_04380 [Novipirellula aureliae]